MEHLLIVEDNTRLGEALRQGLDSSEELTVVGHVISGEEAIELCLTEDLNVSVVLMDVALAGEMSGIEAAIAIRREFPRMPVVFYSIQDDDAYFRAFRHAGILSHYAYVKKSNYLLPEMILPLIRDACAGRGFIDPDIEARVQEVRHKDSQNPMDLLEPNEQMVARMLAAGMTNEQIAARLGFRDKRTISRTNGQIYAAWGLVNNNTDEKIARTRAVIVALEGRLINWDDEGNPTVMDTRGNWVDWDKSA